MDDEEMTDEQVSELAKSVDPTWKKKGGFTKPPDAGWQDGLGLRGQQADDSRGVTIQGDDVQGHGRRYVVNPPQTTVWTTP